MGEWINTAPGFTSEFLRRRWGPFHVSYEDFYEVRLKPYPGALTYRVNDGLFLQPDRRGVTNFGSIPPPINRLPGFERTRFRCTYYMHDSGCDNHGLYVASTCEGPFEFEPMTHEKIHHYLYEWVRAEGGSRAVAATIYRAVWAFGPRWKLNSSEQNKEVRDE